MALQIIVKNSSVSGNEPTAGQLANGELALNYHANGPFITCKDTAGVVRRVTGVWVNATAPSSPTPGELWLDISVTPVQLKVYKNDGDTWVAASTVYAATTSVAGVVQLSDSTSTTSSILAATPTAVKVAYDLANAALPKTGGTVTGNVILDNQVDARFREATANGTNYVGFQAPATIAADVLWTLPAVDGTAGQVISTNGTGTLSWASAATGDVTLTGTQTLTNKTLTSPILTTPALGTPSSGTLTSCTGLPISGLTASTSTALGVGSIELGDASDTTLSRSAAGVLAVEGVVIPSISSTSTLTNKTLTDPAIIGTILEDVFTFSSPSATFEVDPGNGSIQLVTLGFSSTPTCNFAAGESVTLMVNDGTNYTITWTNTTWGPGGVIWKGGTAPTLATTGYSVIQFWKVSAQVYGASVGDVA